MTTPTPTDSDHASTIATPGRRRQHAAPSQPDLAAKSRRRAGCQERAVRPRRRRPRRGDLYSRGAGATIIEVRWEGAPRQHGSHDAPPARTPAQPGTNAASELAATRQDSVIADRLSLLPLRSAPSA